jgi:nitrate/nitrite transport system substrate-binding protein
MTKLWTRRNLLTGAGATTAAIAFSSCGHQRVPNPSPPTPLEIQPIIDSRLLEKPDLTIGFVPVNDCAPFAVAWEKGFFRKYGLNVTLSREASWANSRDGIVFGRLDASPVVSGSVTNARMGAEGARPFPLCAAMTIHRHGNGLTMNRGLWEAGLRPWYSYRGNLDGFGQDLRNYWQKLPVDGHVWAVVLSSSIYDYFVRYLLAAVGIDPIRQLRLIITPPPRWSAIPALAPWKLTWLPSLGIPVPFLATRALALPFFRDGKYGVVTQIGCWQYGNPSLRIIQKPIAP